MTDEMSICVAKLAQATHEMPDIIWGEVNKKFIEKGGNSYQGSRQDQIAQIMYNKQREEAREDAINSYQPERSVDQNPKKENNRRFN